MDRLKEHGSDPLDQPLLMLKTRLKCTRFFNRRTLHEDIDRSNTPGEQAETKPLHGKDERCER
jgi:hypothetical protein